MDLLQAGMSQHQAGDLDAAIASFRTLLTHNPNDPNALHMMGVIAQQRGNSELALKFIESALAVDPDFAMAWSNRAMILRVFNRDDEAMYSIRQAISLNPDLADSYDIAGSLLRKIKKYDEAAVFHQRALAMQPYNPIFLNNYAVLLMAMGDIRGAYKAVKRSPDDTLKATEDIPLIVGNILQAAGYADLSIDYYHETFKRHPHLVTAQVSEALANLKIGNFRKGWDLWKIRFDRLENSFNKLPVWEGEQASHLVLYEDQGLGDAIQAIRYIDLIRERVRTITVYLLTIELVDLFKTSFPDIIVLVHDQPIPDDAVRCLMMSLPSIFETTLESIPARVPYLQVPPHNPSLWHDRLAACRRPRIGLVWAGNVNYPNDANRSIHFSQMGPLVNAGRGHLVSLQKGIQKEQADLVATGICDADPWLNNFADTACLVDHLDLVITVDTSVAHLVGALGKPVWLLLPFDPDWRWMLERADSPWYPTMRLFRQTAPRDWPPVIEHVAADVQKFIHGDQSVLVPQRWDKPPVQRNKNALDLGD